MEKMMSLDKETEISSISSDFFASDIFGDVSSSDDGEDGIADRSLTQEGEEPNDAEFGDNPAEQTEGNSDLMEDNFDSCE